MLSRGRLRSHMGPGTAVHVDARTASGMTRYFRTQITRTTDALASGDPPAALTPLALRKVAHRVCCHQHGLCRRRAVRRAGHLHRLQQRDAGELAVAIERGRAGEANRRRRRQRHVIAAVELGDRRLDAADGRTAALVLRIGNSGQVERGFRGGAGEIDRLQPARAVDAQQREVVLLVLGDAIRIAKACDRDREAAIGDLAVGDDRAVLADDDAGAVFHGLARRRSRRLRAAGNALNALDIAITTGSTVFSVAWS